MNTDREYVDILGSINIPQGAEAWGRRGCRGKNSAYTLQPILLCENRVSTAGQIGMFRRGNVIS